MDSLGSGGDARGGAAGQEYALGRRRLRVVRQLGEGGYSFVYLVRELAGDGSGLLPAGGAPQLYALKRVRRPRGQGGALCGERAPALGGPSRVPALPLSAAGLPRPLRCCAAAQTSCGRRSGRWR